MERRRGTWAGWLAGWLAARAALPPRDGPTTTTTTTTTITKQEAELPVCEFLCCSLAGWLFAWLPGCLAADTLHQCFSIPCPEISPNSSSSSSTTTAAGSGIDNKTKQQRRRQPEKTPNGPAICSPGSIGLFCSLAG